MFLPIEIEAHTYFEIPLDLSLVGDVERVVETTRRALADLGEDPKLISAHAALRHLVGAPVDEQTLHELPNPVLDLVDILRHVLRDYAAALSRLHALAESVEQPPNPEATRRRLLGEAEKELNKGARADLARAEALARLADRWATL